MGSLHCIPNSCSSVIYQEYLPPQIRYRYPGEEWQIVDGDDYTLAQSNNLTSTRPYQIKGKSLFPYAYTIRSGRGRCVLYDFNQFIAGREYTSVNNTLRTYFVWGPIYDWRFAHYQTSQYQCSNDGFSVPELRNVWPEGYMNIEILCHGASSGCSDDPSRRLANPTWVTWFQGAGLECYVSVGFDKIDFFPCQNLSPVCKFTVYKNGAIVHQETRSVCPEVEQTPCVLDENSQVIKINKVPWLSAISVLEYAKDAIQVPGSPIPIPTVRGIPSECLNIYRNEIFDPLPEGEVEDPDEPIFGDFIGQICSAPGCPPPEYRVLCDCDCRNCPENSCPVVCGEKICCYDTATGKAVDEIPIGEYCGGAI